MCCRTTVAPIPPEWPLILEIAGFKRMDKTWSRVVNDECAITASLSLLTLQDGLEFRLTPSIGSHSAEEHAINAASAAIMYKCAMTLAERAGGRVVQQSLVAPCSNEGGSIRELADYALGRPLTFDNLCLGFRSVLLQGVRQ